MYAGLLVDWERERGVGQHLVPRGVAVATAAL